MTCLLRRHDWEQHADAVGTVTYCSRCGKIRHAPRSGGRSSIDAADFDTYSELKPPAD